MERKVNWRPALFDYLDNYAVDPATMSCATFIADGVKVMTGKEVLPDIGRGTPKEQYRALHAAGYKSVEQYIGDHAIEVLPATAQVGDISTMPGDWGGLALGFVTGAEIRVLTPDGKTGIVPMTMAERVFRI